MVHTEPLLLLKSFGKTCAVLTNSNTAKRAEGTVFFYLVLPSLGTLCWVWNTRGETWKFGFCSEWSDFEWSLYREHDYAAPLPDTGGLYTLQLTLGIGFGGPRLMCGWFRASCSTGRAFLWRLQQNSRVRWRLDPSGCVLECICIWKGSAFPLLKWILCLTEMDFVTAWPDGPVNLSQSQWISVGKLTL